MGVVGVPSHFAEVVRIDVIEHACDGLVFGHGCLLEPALTEKERKTFITCESCLALTDATQIGRSTRALIYEAPCDHALGGESTSQDTFVGGGNRLRVERVQFL